MKRIGKNSLTASIALLTLGLTNSVVAAGELEKTEANAAATVLEQAYSVKVLPEDVSRTLKIDRLPQVQPFIFGTYWSCFYEGDHEICRIKLVVCTDDQSVCVEH